MFIQRNSQNSEGSHLVPYITIVALLDLYNRELKASKDDSGVERPGSTGKTIRGFGFRV